MDSLDRVFGLFFANLLQMQVHDDIATTIDAWQDSGCVNSYQHTIVGLLPGLICWHIWRERYNRRFSEHYKGWHQVALEIVADYNLMVSNMKFLFLGGLTVSLSAGGFIVPTSLHGK